MAGGIGDQTILWNYGSALQGAILAEGMTDIVQAGVYDGLVGTKVSPSTIQFSAGSLFIKDSNFNTSKISVRIGFGTVFSASIDIANKKDYLAVRFTYLNSVGNYATVINVGVADLLPTDVILGRAIWDNSSSPTQVSSWDNSARQVTPGELFLQDNAFWVSPGSSPFTVKVSPGVYVAEQGRQSFAGEDNVSIPSAGQYLVCLNRDGNTIAVVQAAASPSLGPGTLPSTHIVLASVTRRSGVSVYNLTEGDITNSFLRFDFSRGKNSDLWDGRHRPIGLGEPVGSLTAVGTDVVTTLLTVGSSAQFLSSATNVPNNSSHWTITAISGGDSATWPKYIAVSPAGAVYNGWTTDGTSISWSRIWNDDRYTKTDTVSLDLPSASKIPSETAVSTALQAQHKTVIETSAPSAPVNGQIWLQ